MRGFSNVVRGVHPYFSSLPKGGWVGFSEGYSAFLLSPEWEKGEPALDGGPGVRGFKDSSPTIFPLSPEWERVEPAPDLIRG